MILNNFPAFIDGQKLRALSFAKRQARADSIDARSVRLPNGLRVDDLACVTVVLSTCEISRAIGDDDGTPEVLASAKTSQRYHGKGLSHIVESVLAAALHRRMILKPTATRRLRPNAGHLLEPVQQEVLGVREKQALVLFKFLYKASGRYSSAHVA